jgi:predicted 3-demethylubiquinone-9 3-methyltransferase (glyoxalase superfamily)
MQKITPFLWFDDKAEEAMNFYVVNCETQQEVDEFWEKLSEGGEKQRCGWLKDKYGLSWQIVPSILGKLLQDKDAAKSTRVMKAMMQMDKLDIRGLEQAVLQ